jgi:hypothetical protein
MSEAKGKTVMIGWNDAYHVVVWETSLDPLPAYALPPPATPAPSPRMEPVDATYQKVPDSLALPPTAEAPLSGTVFLVNHK